MSVPTMAPGDSAGDRPPGTGDKQSHITCLDLTCHATHTPNISGEVPGTGPPAPGGHALTAVLPFSCSLSGLPSELTLTFYRCDADAWWRIRFPVRSCWWWVYFVGSAY